MIYVVSGYMRSGTSMMMEAMHAGGLPLAYEPNRNRMSQFYSDTQYAANQHGLYEFLTHQMRAPNWPTQYAGHCIKAIDLAPYYLSVAHYAVVFMWRDAEEIRQSLEAAFGLKESIEMIEAKRHLAWTLLQNRKDVTQIVKMHYPDVLEQPEAMLQSLGWPIDVKKAASVIDPAQYRFQRERLMVGL